MGKAAVPIGKALARAKKDKRRVEIESLRSENATYYANPDGKTVRMELHTQPIRVKTADGKGFTPIDTTLVETDGAIKPKATTGNFVLSAGRDKTLIKSRVADATAKINTPSALPEPEVKGDTATYPDAYGKGRDLVVTATPTGFRQQIVIAERPAGPVSFRVPVELPEGLSFTTNAAGRPVIVDEKGTTLTEVRPTLLQDATAADAEAPMGAGRVGKADVKLAEDGKALVFTPDAAFLADPAVTYPVTMAAATDDWWESDTSEWHRGGMDTFVNNAEYPDSWDNFNLDRILVGKSNSGTVRWRGYLKFPDIPAEFAGSMVQNADLILWNYLSNTCGARVGSGITARRITSDWDELTLHWNRQPSVTNEGADTEYGAYSSDCNYAWDLIHSVDEIVQAWISGAPNYGIQLAAGNESDLTNWRRYRSAEAGGCATAPREQCKGRLHPPLLTVDLELPTTTRTLLAWTESGPGRTSIPSPEEALALAQGFYPVVPNFPDLSEDEAAQLEAERGQPYFIGPEQLQPIDGEDWSQPDPLADEQAPRVISVTPADGAKDVPVSTKVAATFDEPVTDVVLSVQDSTGNAVSGTVSMDETGKTVTFTPDQQLRAGVTYTAEVRNAVDASSNRMDDYPWTFTIGGPAAHWTFDEGDGRTAADSSGNGHDATLNDTAAWIAGKSGNAISNLPSQARIAASQAAVKQGKAVEVADETTATSITYAQPDGKTFKTEIAAGPVRTRRDGAWVPIDTRLVEKDGKLTPKAIAEGTAVEISTGGAGPFARMIADGRSYALRWPTPLPKPTVKGNVATFTDAAGAGADLVVTVLPTGFRHDVVLRQRPAKPLQIRIGVEGDLTLAESKGGRLLLKGGNGKPVASVPQPIMWDGSAKGRLPLAKHAKVDTDVVTTGRRTELVLKPDHGFLTDPGTRYPVRVDPTVTLPLGSDVEVSSDNDADWPADPTSPFLLVGTQTGGYKYRVHMKFDTTGLAGSTVSDARLSVNTIDAPGCGPVVGAGIQAARLTSAWDPERLHWGNLPAFTTEDASTNTKGVSQDCATWPDVMEWDVTGIVQDWAAGAANHGLVLKSPNETNTDNYRVFTASEDTEFNVPPTLTVTTSGPASAPTVGELVISPAQQVDGTTVTGSLTPQLAATVTDTIGGELTGQFEVEHDPDAPDGQGSGRIWEGSSSAVTSGGQATVTIPAGTLADGWKIRWRARAVNPTAGTTSAWSDWQTVTVDVPNPTVGAFQVTPSQVVDGVTVTPSLTPALQATVTDPAGQPLRVEFEIEHDPAAPDQGNGRIWSGNVDDVASGTQASLTVPAGTLSDGWKVRWRARAVNTATTVSSPWSDWQALTVDAPDPVSEPTVSALQVTPSQVVDGVTVTPSLTPALQATVTDPAGRPLRVEFEIEHDPDAPDEQGSGQIWTGSVDDVSPGTQASLTVPAGTLSDGWKVRWRARAVSSTAASDWSSWQSFTVRLPEPTVTDLIITPSQVVDGVTVTPSLTPALQATVTDPAGQPLRVEFEIEHDPAAPDGQGSGQIWSGNVDDVASGTQASLTVPAGTLSDGWKVRWRVRAVTGQTSSPWSDWQPVTIDVVQPGEEPLAQTAGPVIRTDQSFTVAAWLRWSDKDGDYRVIEQKGTHQAPFRLGNTPEHGLVFTFTNADAADAAIEGVLSGIEPPVDEWFHLAGVYDATTKTASLYLNGQPVKSAQLGFAPWNASSKMLIGAMMLGDIDDARVYQRGLTAEQVASLAEGQPADLTSRPNSSKRTISANVIPTFDYQRMTLEDCERERDARLSDKEKDLGIGWDNVVPYGGCWSRHALFAIYKETTSYDENCKCMKKKKGLEDIEDFLNVDFTVVMHSYLGDNTGNGVIGGGGVQPRDIKVWTRVDNIWADGGFLNRLLGGDGLDEEDLKKTLTVTLKVKGGATACSVISSDVSGGGASRSDSVAKWRAKGDNLFIVRSAKGAPSRCTIEPWLIYNNPTAPGNADQQVIPAWGHAVWVNTGDERLRKTAPRVRCDSLAMGSAVSVYIGGCIFYGASRVLRMATHDLNYGAVAQHIQKAFTRPQDTVPVKTDGPKRIPGNWDADRDSPERRPLERIYTNTNAYKANVEAKNRVCDEFFDERPRKKTGETDESRWEECDEYPFASTRQGGGYTDPKYGKNNFSVQSILRSQNASGGAALNVFYARYRVLAGNNFWVSIQ